MSMRKHYLLMVGLVYLGAGALLSACGRGSREGAPAAFAPEAAAEQPAPDPATELVTVNDEVITQADVDRQMMQMFAQAGQAMELDQIRQFAGQIMPQILDSMVVRKLLDQEVERRRIVVSEEQIDETLAEIAQTLPDGMTLQEALEREGMSEADLRKNIAEGLRIQNLIEARMTKAADPTAEDIAGFYRDHPQHFEQEESFEARHILFGAGKDEDEATHAAQKAKAEEVLAALRGGSDFESLAQEHSACPSSREGGRLPPFGKDQMVPPFEEATRRLEAGELSPVVQTDFGYHIIRLEAYQEARKQSLPEVAERIRDHLKQQREQAAVGDVIADLRSQADIRYHQPGLKPAESSCCESPDCDGSH